MRTQAGTTPTIRPCTRPTPGASVLRLSFRLLRCDNGVFNARRWHPRRTFTARHEHAVGRFLKRETFSRQREARSGARAGNTNGTIEKDRIEFHLALPLTGLLNPVQNFFARNLDRSREPAIRDTRNRRGERHNITRQVNGQVSGGVEIGDSISADGSRLRVDDVVVENNFCDGRHEAPRKSGYGL